MTTADFGIMPDGAAVTETVLRSGALTAKILNFGAVIRDIRLDGVAWPLVLGFDRIEHYLGHSPYFGAVVGRYANRIAGGRLVLDGRTCQLALNENGRTHLHGGFNGFGARLWRLAAHDEASVLLALTSSDGEEGYPGKVEATCRYTVEPPAVIRAEFTAAADAPTIVNLAQHSYFNLGGTPDILGHRVAIHADAYTPVDDDRIPTGIIAPVAGTAFDFRELRPIRRVNGAGHVDYDVNYVVDSVRAPAPRPVARLESPEGDVRLDIASTEPGVQFYDGCHMPSIPVAGLDGRRYGRNGGCCFEPQVFPDSPNQPGFPTAVLRPGETYRQTTIFAFSRS